METILEVKNRFSEDLGRISEAWGASHGVVLEGNFYKNNYHSYVVKKASNALKAIQYMSNSVNASTIETYPSIDKNMKKWLNHIYRLAVVCRNSQIMKLYQTMYYAVFAMRDIDDTSNQLGYLKRKSQECWSALYAYYNDVVNNTEDMDRKYLDMFVEPGSVEDMMSTIQNTPTDELSGVVDSFIGSEQSNQEKQEEVDELDDELSSGGYEAVKIDFFGDDWFGFGSSSNASTSSNTPGVSLGDFDEPYQRPNF